MRYVGTLRKHIDSLLNPVDVGLQGHLWWALTVAYSYLEPESYQPVFRRIYCLTIVIPGSKKVGTNRASDFLIESPGHFKKHVGEVI